MSKLEKHQIADMLLMKIDEECEVIQSAVTSAVAAATDSEAKPENKYDTRALEASYLAGAQAARLDELKGMRAFISTLNWHATPSTAIKALSLVELQCDEKVTWWLLLPFGGGYKLKFPHIEIQTITVNSPLGQGMIGKTAGDYFELRVGEADKEYQVISIH